MKVVMMDVDGVLVRGRPGDGLPFATDLEKDLGLSLDVWQREFFKPYWSDIVIGREPMMERLTSVLAAIAPHLSARTLADYWFENDSGLDHAVLNAMARYRAEGIKVFLATNQEHLRAAYLMEQLGLAAHVDGIVYSAALGHRKPAPEFYAGAALKTKAAPRDIVLVDDTLANVEPARTAGWNAVHWTGAGILHDALAPFRPASATS